MPMADNNSNLAIAVQPWQTTEQISLEWPISLHTFDKEIHDTWSPRILVGK
jgi:hypothetical protein